MAATVALPADFRGYAPREIEFPLAASYLNPQGEIVIIGYNDMAEMVGSWNRLFTETHPAFKFSTSLPSTRSAPPALAAGKSALAPMGAEFSAEELASYEQRAGGKPVLFRVAHCSLDPRALSGPLGIFVHHDSALTALSLPELADYFSGAKNTLRPYGLRPSAALALYFRGHVLGNRPWSKDYKGFAQSAEVIAQVAADPQSIGFAALNRGIADPRVRCLALAAKPDDPPIVPTAAAISGGTYPLDRFLLIYARQPLDAFTREYMRMVLSAAGQAIIQEGALGYLRLNAKELETELSKIR